MRRDHPRSVTFILIFLAVYLLVTGTLLLVLRGSLLDKRADERADLEARVATLEDQVHEHAAQEDAIVRELISTAGADDFEDAYRTIRDEIENLSAEVHRIDGIAGEERQARLAAEDERDERYSRVQALSLQKTRLEANLDQCTNYLLACEDELAMC